MPFEIHKVDPQVEERKISELVAFRSRRDQPRVDACLDALRETAASDENLMPATIAAIRARATGGEIVETVRSVFGSYVEHAVF
jgi:methylmalonyl-CoA mutase N-terminal domain/subunit